VPLSPLARMAPRRTLQPQTAEVLEPAPPLVVAKNLHHLGSDCSWYSQYVIGSQTVDLRSSPVSRLTRVGANGWVTVRLHARYDGGPGLDGEGRR
jgi:hypothetical protein